MKQIASFEAVMVVLLLGFANSAFAEKIDHHGVVVEAAGSARDCISCHDGSTGKHTSFCRVKCDFKGSHSILKSYPPQGKEREYASAAVILAQGVRLENGKVTCISWHDLRNSGNHHLIMSNKGSRLCLVCHIRM